MLSAVLLFSDQYTAMLVFWQKPLKVIAFAAIILFCTIAIAFPSIRDDSKWFTDFLMAVFCATLILFLAATAMRPYTSRGFISGKVIRLLEPRPFSLLGEFSYSLYLTHLVVWAMLGITLNLAPVKRLVDFSFDPMATRILVLLPLLLVSAYGFYLLFEKPFLRRK